MEKIPMRRVLAIYKKCNSLFRKIFPNRLTSIFAKKHVNWKRKDECIWKHKATFIALFAMFLVALLSTKWFNLKSSNKQKFEGTCLYILQKSSLKSFKNNFTMVLLFIIVCLNVATVIAIIVFYKFRKLNTHSTKKEVKKELCTRQKLNKHYFLNILCLNF